ncbi:MAG: hypothetical protein HZC55_21990 [Verrucomicrobia bacterium]|nr:hypothetical protein [Verrucomicrobiota bacterium]
MKLPRIYADFNKQDTKGRLVLTCAGTRRDLQQIGLTLSEGLKVLLYSDDTDEKGRPDDIEVEGVVKFDPANGRWVAEYRPAEIRHMSEKADRVS